MSGSFIQSGSLAGAVSSIGMLQANVYSQGELKATIASEGTLQATVAAEGTLHGTMVPERTLEGTIYMPEKVTIDNGKIAKISEVALLAAAWEGSENLFYQIVNIEGVTENCQIDLTPSVEQLMIFYEKDLTFVTENDNGTVTVYAIGQKPLNDYTIQVTITEVDV